MKTKNQRLTLIVLLLACVFLTACRTSQTITVNGTQCIQPKLTAIPPKMPLWGENRQVNGSRKFIPAREPIPQWLIPQFTWSQQREIPADSFPIEMESDGNTLWMVFYQNLILKYNLSTRQFHKYSFENQVPSLFIDDMVATKDHNLWIVGTRVSKGRQYPVLMRYNAENDAFEDVQDSDGLLLPLDGSIITSNSHKRLLQEAADGSVLFIFREGIYSYNPLANKAAVVFSDESVNVASLETDPRGMIWFTVLKEDALWMLDPGTQKTEKFEIPTLPMGPIKLMTGTYYGRGYTPYLDSRNRIWISGWAFIDTSEDEFTWHTLKPDPMFVDLYDTDHIYTWDQAYTIFEAQDGTMWFTTDNGVLNFDPKTESVCWISPEFGKITQSEDGSIWILLDNQLYKYVP